MRLGLATTDEAQREEYYNEAQEICIDDCTKLCIASPMKYFVMSNNVHGFTPLPPTPATSVTPI